jgi:hypothetical protein
MKGLPDFPALFKKRSEVKYKKQVFSTENKEQHLNLKRTEIITCMRGFAPSYTYSQVNTLLVILKFY